MQSIGEARRLVGEFVPSPEEQKSHELTLALLEQTETPFSRHQFHPGHITCSALVLNVNRDRVLLMHHHVHRRWLLPGGHVEETDATLGDAARRETMEETAVSSTPLAAASLVGMDVHGISARKGEPFHLHHDLVFALDAESDEFACTDEAPRVAWCGVDEFERYAVPGNIRRAASRALLR